MAIEVFSFFSGLGFMDLGFEEAGFDIAFVNEYNHSFIQAYQYARRNRPHRPQYGYYEGSIEEFLDDRVWNQRFPDYDVRNKDRIIGFIGGPPCPDFSTAGKNAGSTGENGKFRDRVSENRRGHHIKNDYGIVPIDETWCHHLFRPLSYRDTFSFLMCRIEVEDVELFFRPLIASN